MEQIKCPNCGNYKTAPDSKKMKLQATGFGMMFLGAIFFLFFIWIVSLPVVIIGLALGISGSVMKDTGEMLCKNCNFKFKKEGLIGKGFTERFKDFLKFRIK